MIPAYQRVDINPDYGQIEACFAFAVSPQEAGEPAFMVRLSGSYHDERGIGAYNAQPYILLPNSKIALQYECQGFEEYMFPEDDLVHQKQIEMVKRIDEFKTTIHDQKAIRQEWQKLDREYKMVEENQKLVHARYYSPILSYIFMGMEKAPLHDRQIISERGKSGWGGEEFVWRENYTPHFDIKHANNFQLIDPRHDLNWQDYAFYNIVRYPQITDLLQQENTLHIITKTVHGLGLTDSRDSFAIDLNSNKQLPSIEMDWQERKKLPQPKLKDLDPDIFNRLGLFIEGGVQLVTPANYHCVVQSPVTQLVAS